MSDDQQEPPKPDIIHLGMMRAGDKGPGTYIGGVFKLGATSIKISSLPRWTS